MTKALKEAIMLCQWIAETPHQRGSINGLAAQVLHAASAALASTSTQPASAVVQPHTLEEDFQHFLAYSNALDTDARLRMAYKHGNERGLNNQPGAVVQEPVAWRRREQRHGNDWVYYETKAWDDLEPMYTHPSASGAAKLNALICAMQADMVKYITPEGCSQDWFVSQMIGHLDGPQQREAQDGTVEPTAQPPCLPDLPVFERQADLSPTDATQVVPAAQPTHDLINHLKDIYAFLADIAPSGIADEAFRNVPNSILPDSFRSEKLSLHPEPSNAHGKRVGLAEQDRDTGGKIDGPVEPTAQPGSECLRAFLYAAKQDGVTHLTIPATTPPPVAGDVQAKYGELIYAVGRKWPGESRHETALRYIRRAEEQKDTDGATPSSKQEGAK